MPATFTIGGAVLRVLLCLAACGICVAQVAHTVLLGGKVLTGDQKNSVAEAVAIAGGRLLAVGTDAQIRKHIGKSTTVVPLNGKTVVPG